MGIHVSRVTCIVTPHNSARTAETTLNATDYTMPLKHNEYYEGNVHSIGFERTGLPASVG